MTAEEIKMMDWHRYKAALPNNDNDVFHKCFISQTSELMNQ